MLCQIVHCYAIASENDDFFYGKSYIFYAKMVVVMGLKGDIFFGDFFTFFFVAYRVLVW